MYLYIYMYVYVYNISPSFLPPMRSKDHPWSESRQLRVLPDDVSTLPPVTESWSRRSMEIPFVPDTEKIYIDRRSHVSKRRLSIILITTIIRLRVQSAESMPILSLSLYHYENISESIFREHWEFMNKKFNNGKSILREILFNAQVNFY